MDPVHLLTDEQLSAQAALANEDSPLPSEVLELARTLSPAQALGQLLSGLAPLPNPEVVMLGDYQSGLAVCRMHAHRLVLHAWLRTVAAAETSPGDPPEHG